MAWDFTGGLSATPNKGEKNKKTTWDFTGGISSSKKVVPAQEESIEAMANRLFVEPSPDRVSPVSSPAPIEESETTRKIREFLGEEYSSP